MNALFNVRSFVRLMALGLMASAAGGAAAQVEGDATVNSRKPVVGILNPGSGVVTAPFRVQVRVFSPLAADNTTVQPVGVVSLQYQGTTNGTIALTKNTKYGSASDSGVWEGVLNSPALTVGGSYTLKASGTNGSGTVWSGPVGVTVNVGRGDGYLLVRDNADQLCSDCHAHKTHSSESLGPTYGSWTTGCRTCHQPHGTTNASLIATQITPPAVNGALPASQVVFSNRRGYVAAGGAVNPALASYVNGDNTGVCQVCHTRTSVFRRDGTLVNHDGREFQNCGGCHSHKDGLAASCTTCHGDNSATPRSTFSATAPPRDSCGNLTPTGGTGINRVGAHAKHLSSGAVADPIACTECHVNPPVRTSHPPAANCGATRAPLSWGAIASGAVDGWSPSVTPGYSTASQTCASTYCHGNFKNSGVTSSVAWGATVACGGCHLLPPSAPTHSSQSTNCAMCHGAGYSTTSGISGAALATHVDGKLDIGAMTCSSCHGTTSRVAAATATTLDVNSQNLVKDAPPADATGATTGARVGAHLQHVNQEATAPALSLAIPCTACHTVPTSSSHPDGSALVTFGGTATARGATPFIDGTKTCSSTYCHGDFPLGNGASAISWGTGTLAKLDCTSCHANSPAHPHPGNQSCADCHTGYSKSGATTGTVTASTHVDGLTTKSTFSCTACHGDLAQAVGVATITTPTLSAPGANAAARSEDTLGGTTTTLNAVGAHRAHLFKTNLRAALACTECHALPPSNTDTTHASDAGTGGARARLTFGTLATGAVDAWSGAAVTPVFSGSTSGSGGTTGGTCASTYCHGNFRNGKNATPAWPGAYSSTLTATTLDCNSCHGSGTGATATPPGGTHPANANCGNCHTGYTGTTVVAATHMNGVLNVAAMTCSSCHGTTSLVPVATATLLDANSQNLVKDAPPVDSHGVATGTEVGTHLSHVNQAATAPAMSKALACTNCHVVPTTSTHADAVALITWGGLATARSAVPTAFNATTHTCSSTYCHGNFPVYGLGANAITWGTTSPGTKQTCTQCHVNPVTVPTYPHPANATCANCHGAGYTATVAPAATHVDGLTTLVSYGCSACHGVLATASPGVLAAAPTNAAPAAAGTGVNTTGAAIVATTAEYGSHRAHLEQTLLRSTTIACADCHAVPVAGDETHATGVGTGGARATLTWSALARGTVDTWSSGTPATPAYTRAGGCATTYCHGQFKNGQLAKTVVWAQDITLTCNSCHGTPGANPATPPTGTHPANANCGNCHTGYTGTTVVAATHINGLLNVAAMTCSSCHGTTSLVPVATATLLDANSQNLVKDAPPVDSHGVATGTEVGTHLSHVNQAATAPAMSKALACTNCHVVPTTSTHADAVALITWGGLATSRSAVPTAFNATTHTCSSTYCHGNFPVYGLGANAITWGTTSPGTKQTCTQCHVNPVTVPTYPHPANATCANCHGAGYTATVAPAATHVDGLTTLVSYGCSACHGVLATASPGVLAAAPTNAAPAAAGTGVNTTGAAIVATTAEYGSHRAHLEQTLLRSTTIACADCHAVPVAGDETHATGVGTGGARATLTWSALARGTVDTWSSGTPATPAYTRAGGCATTYCHGQFKNGQLAKTVVWAQDITLTCNSCHGTPGANPATPPGGTHPANANCGNCHTGYTGTTVVAATHINGLLNVAAMTCSSCHGTTSLVPVATATLLDANSQNLVKDAPPVDSHGVATGTEVGTHLSHVNQAATAPAMSKALACTNCHVVPTTSTHADAVALITWGGLATSRSAVPTAFNATTHTCSSTYCHGNFPVYGLGANAITWGTTSPGTKQTCTQCHVNPVTVPTYPHPANATCANCHGAGYTATVAPAATHVDGLTTLVSYGCSACHGVLATASPGVLAAAPTNAAPGAAGTGVSTRGASAITAPAVGAHAVHLTGTTLRATAITCNECHAVPVAGDETHATGAGTGGAYATLTFGTLAKTGSLVPTYAGSNSATTNTTAGSCATVYCHGGKWAANANYAGTEVTPLWTDPVGAACGTCHKIWPTSSGHTAMTNTKNCGDCHPGYNYTVQAGGTVSLANHINGKLDGGLSPGKLACDGCHEPISTAMTNATHKHVLTSYAAPTSATTYAITTNQASCVQCHVDHDLFNPPLTPAANLRSSATVANPTATATDHNAGTGVCVSCHGTNAFTKASGGTTPTVNGANFTASAHDYATEPTSTFTAGGTFSANCSKCHNDTSTKQYQAAGNQFALHDTTQTSMLAPLGAIDPDPLEEHACYRCHSHQADAVLGTKKPTDGYDWYGTTSAPMAAPAEDVFTQAQKGSAGSAAYTVTGNALYFRASSNPTAGAYQIAAGTYRGDTGYRGYLMTPGSAGTVQTTFRQTEASTATNRYYRLAQFISPPINVASNNTAYTTASALSLVYTSKELLATENANVRYAAYKWTAGNVWTAFKTVTAATLEMGNNVNDTYYTDTINFTPSSAVTFNTGDRIVIELEVLRAAAVNTDVTLAWAGADASRVVLPGNVTFDVPATTASGRHDVGAYSGIHKPSPTDETRAYIAANKHVECADCHDPHEAKQRVANSYGAASGAGTTTTLVDATKAWTAGQWVGARMTIRSGTRAWLGGTVTANTATQLTFTPAIASATAAADSYILEWPNGGGPVTAAGTNVTTITTGKTYVLNQWAGYTVYVMTPSTGVVQNRTVTSNTAAGVLTVSAAITTATTDLFWMNKTPDLFTGATGVDITTWPVTPAAATWSTTVLGATYNPATTTVALPVAVAEWQVCFKCHSGANANILGTTAPGWSAGQSVTGTFTDLATEFNPRNQSYHPVVAPLPVTDPGANGSSRLEAVQLTNGWQPGQMMTCTDCHNTDAAAPAAQGPHGSAYKYMLAGVNKAWPFTVAGATSGTLFRTSSTNNYAAATGTVNGLFCLNCHPAPNAGTTVTNSLHVWVSGQSGTHSAANDFYACLACHIRVPHGGKVSRLIRTTAAPARYTTTLVNPGFTQFLKGTRTSYSQTAGWNSGCGAHGGATGESW